MTLAITPHLDPDQQAQAACRDQPSDLWYPVRGDNGSKAKAFCRRCPVRVACLTNAVARNEEFGVWGGAGEPARRGLRRAWLAGGDEWAEAVAVHFDALDAGRPLVLAQAKSHARRGGYARAVFAEQHATHPADLQGAPS